MADGRENRRRTPLASRHAISWLRCSTERSIGSSSRMEQYTSQVGIALGRSVCERVCQNRLGHGKLHRRAFRHKHDLSSPSGESSPLRGSRSKAGNPQGPAQAVTGSTLTAGNALLCPETETVHRVCRASASCAICTHMARFGRLDGTKIAIGRSQPRGSKRWPLMC
jgi:hypothetical protein